LSAHALTPPASFIEVFNRVGGTLQRPAYRNARAHLLIVLAVDAIRRRAANDSRNGIRIPVEGQASKFE
jgi:hypothetical protein